MTVETRNLITAVSQTSVAADSEVEASKVPRRATFTDVAETMRTVNADQRFPRKKPYSSIVIGSVSRAARPGVVNTAEDTVTGMRSSIHLGRGRSDFLGPISTSKRVPRRALTYLEGYC